MTIVPRSDNGRDIGSPASSDNPVTEIFDITPDDVGRYVRRKSTGDVGMIRRDPGNGWLHTGIVYEWKQYRNDFEYVTVEVGKR